MSLDSDIGDLLAKRAEELVWDRWASWPAMEDLLRLAALRIELGLASEREDGASLAVRDPAAYLLRLQGEVYVVRMMREQDRQREACAALGVEFEVSDKAHLPSLRPLPWSWCFAEPESDGRPVVYPSDWQRELEPDRHGAGGRWRAGQVLVVVGGKAKRFPGIERRASGAADTALVESLLRTRVGQVAVLLDDARRNSERMVVAERVRCRVEPVAAVAAAVASDAVASGAAEPGSSAADAAGRRRVHVRVGEPPVDGDRYLREAGYGSAPDGLLP